MSRELWNRILAWDGSLSKDEWTKGITWAKTHIADLEERLRSWERSSAESGTVLIRNERYNELLEKEAQLEVLAEREKLP